MLSDSAVIVLDDLGISGNEMLMMKQAGDLLERLYPGHAWMVGITGGVMDIRPMSAPVGKMVYTIKHVDSYSASDLEKRVMRAGGAWLEVLKQRRGAIDRASLDSLPTNFAGQVKLEL